MERLDGHPTLMVPRSERHRLIVSDLLQCLSGPAKDRQRRALPGLGALSDQNDLYAPIPDIVVRCGPLARDGDARDPICVAEIQSPSTMDHDRGDRVCFYESVLSPRTILIVYGNEERVDVRQRDGSDAWAFACAACGGALDLGERALSPRVADVYDGLAL